MWKILLCEQLYPKASDQFIGIWLQFNLQVDPLVIKHAVAKNSKMEPIWIYSLKNVKYVDNKYYFQLYGSSSQYKYFINFRYVIIIIPVVIRQIPRSSVWLSIINRYKYSYSYKTADKK